jgi:hypothetical protein
LTRGDLRRAGLDQPLIDGPTAPDARRSAR